MKHFLSLLENLTNCPNRSSTYLDEIWWVKLFGAPTSKRHVFSKTIIFSTVYNIATILITTYVMHVFVRVHSKFERKLLILCSIHAGLDKEFLLLH